MADFALFIYYTKIIKYMVHLWMEMEGVKWKGCTTAIAKCAVGRRLDVEAYLQH